MSTLRRRIRSTQTPAGSPTSRNARNSHVVSSPTSNGPASSTLISSSGSAMTVTWVPAWLSASAAHSRLKSACRRSLFCTIGSVR